MIVSYRNKALRRFAEQGDASKLSVQNLERVRRILLTLNAAATLDLMDQSGWRFHSLKGRDKGRYAVDASANWLLLLAGTVATRLM